MPVAQRERIVELLSASEVRFESVFIKKRTCRAMLPAKWLLPCRFVLMVPVMIGEDVAAICEFGLDNPESDPLLLAILTSIGRQLGAQFQKRLADQRLTEISGRLYDAEDQERRRLSRELHDTTGQNLAAILLNLEITKRNAVLNERAKSALSECQVLAHECVSEIRTCSYALHPPLVSELGFLKALRIYVENFAKRSGTKIEMDLPQSYPVMPPKLDAALFRVVQEGLMNAKRYASGSPCKVSLTVNPSEIRLAVENDVSERALPDSAERALPRGVGLSGARERVQYCGGTLAIHFEENRTLLEASIPLSNATAQSA